MSTRIIDIQSLEQLSALVEIAKDSGLAISIDYMPQLEAWIIQLFDAQERLIVSANAKNPNDAIRKVYSNWFSKTGPKL